MMKHPAFKPGVVLVFCILFLSANPLPESKIIEIKILFEKSNDHHIQQCQWGPSYYATNMDLALSTIVPLDNGDENFLTLILSDPSNPNSASVYSTPNGVCGNWALKSALGPNTVLSEVYSKPSIYHWAEAPDVIFFFNL